MTAHEHRAVGAVTYSASTPIRVESTTGSAVSQPARPLRSSVLEALRLANLTARGPVRATHVAAIISDDAGSTTGEHANGRLSADAVERVLDVGTAEGIVEIVGRPGGAALYVHAEARQLLQAELGLEVAASRRQRTRALVLEAARTRGRAVRFCDIIEHRDQSGWASDIERAAIGRDIQSLCRSGEIVIAREVLGGGVDGQFFYLPASLASGNTRPFPVPEEPASWLEHVLAAFRELWEEEVATAATELRRPRPLTTGALRSRLLESTDLPQARDEQLVPNALGQLAKASPPRVRIAIQRKGSHYALWAPAEVPDGELDLGNAFVSDTARVVEAAVRAMTRLGRPAVGRREVEAEIARDPSLRPGGDSSVASLLADASKELLDAGTGTRRQRVDAVLTRLGHVDGEAYYVVRPRVRDGAADLAEDAREAGHATGHDVALRYVDFRRLESRWRARDVFSQMQGASESLSAAGAVGRLRVIAQGLGQTVVTLGELQDALVGLVPGIARTLEDLQGEVVTAQQECARHAEAALHEARRLREWTPEMEQGIACGVLEATGVASLTGVTADDSVRLTLSAGDVFELVRSRGYARAKRATSATELVPLLSHRLLRVENGDYAGWRKQASEYLFERTNALLFTAIEWGGGTAVLYAQLARQELGQLRDARFVEVGLAHPRFDARMASAAALAFLPSDCESDERLARVTLEDPDAGVRRAALWAYGAGDRAGVVSLAERVLESESHRDVIALARGALEDPRTIWWNC